MTYFPKKFVEESIISKYKTAEDYFEDTGLQTCEKMYVSTITKMKGVAKEGNVLIDSDQLLNTLGIFLSRYSKDPVNFNEHWIAANG